MYIDLSSIFLLDYVKTVIRLRQHDVISIRPTWLVLADFARMIHARARRNCSRKFLINTCKHETDYFTVYIRLSHARIQPDGQWVCCWHKISSNFNGQFRNCHQLRAIRKQYTRLFVWQSTLQLTARGMDTVQQLNSCRVIVRLPHKTTSAHVFYMLFTVDRIYLVCSIEWRCDRVDIWIVSNRKGCWRVVDVGCPA